MGRALYPPSRDGHGNGKDRDPMGPMGFPWISMRMGKRSAMGWECNTVCVLHKVNDERKKWQASQ